MTRSFSDPHRRTRRSAQLLALLLSFGPLAARSAPPEPGPAAQPPDAPAHGPASAPSSRPASAPSSAPTSRPVGRPASAPTSQPANQPDGDQRPAAPAAEHGTPAKPAAEQPKAGSAGREEVELAPMTVTATTADRAWIAGPANLIDDEQLQRFEYDDIHRVLLTLPGIYVRGEDGYGLRPNIGIRGTSSKRSSKITLMEDGVLLAPAPYSAPAAYYFPLVTRMRGVEVFKGPATIRYGPYTVGGAINLLTRRIPREMAGYLDVSAGTTRYGKLHGGWGMSGEHWGVLVEGIHLRSDGFKELDNGGNTGFAKSELMLKARAQTTPGQRIHHRGELKLGYSEETSHETYLGLSQQDFEKTPYRRYAASQQGKFTWWRTQVEGSYRLRIGGLSLKLTGYRHDFSRSWRKLNGFQGGPSLAQLLANPQAGQNAVFYRVLSGAADSSGSAQTLLVGTNARTFVAQGVMLGAKWRVPELWTISQKLRTGVRFHHDRIIRDHTEDGLFMRRGTLVPDGSATRSTTNNEGSAFALSAYLFDEIRWRDLLVSPGLRLEVIRTRFEDFLADSDTARTDAVVLPALGVHYQLLDWLGLVAGVHRGFSPVAPGQPDAVEPENSVNYEGGAQLSWPGATAEVIGFFNDYSNLVDVCSFESGSCSAAQSGRQFNGGAVDIYGLEAMVAQQLHGPWGIDFFGRVSYTLTLSSFRTSLRSDAPYFGDVEKGDRLAYLPIHQAALVIGAFGKRWTANASVSVVDEMRDIAGQGDIPTNQRIPPRAVVDLSGSFAATRNVQLYINIYNLLNTAYMIGRRPFGARPGRPLQVFGGVKVAFGH